MESTIRLIDLLGAGALLIWGLRLIKAGVLSGFGAALRQGIATGTRTRLRAVLSGFLVTLSLQSSTATAVITASFAGRGLIGGGRAQAVMLGANVGTALAAVVLSLDLHWLASVFVLVGVVLSIRARQASARGLGKAVLGLGLMLLALRLMGEVTAPLHGSELMARILDGLGAAPVFALLFAAGLAVAATSSLAAVLLVAFLAQAGAVPPFLVLIFVAGANIGGAVPPWLGTLREGVAATRLTLANLMVRLCGGLLLSLFAHPLAPLLQNLVPGESLALITHLAFNLALLVVFLPLTGPLARLMERLLPEVADAEAEVSYLDESSLATPSLALAGAAREVLRMGDQVGEMLESNLEAMRRDLPEGKRTIAQLDDSVDAKLRAVKFYLARLRGMPLDESEARRCNEVMSYALNIEHIGDIIDHYLSEIAEKRMARRVRFSAQGMAELTEFYEITLSNLRLAQSVFLTRDVELARQLITAKVSVREVEEVSSARHMARIDARLPETMDTSSLHLDILRDLRRINSHLATAAYPVLEEIGALRKSRLRSPPKKLREGERLEKDPAH
ncbi:Na/Pi cotransporter family protein [Phaeovulum sp. W22_SRMD_FR3]|uniref:Na/Pi cotransporter family protein n=1 Tax=Phaeovulum sp. W22_SRMD_FR3 TaxID=3240274 RepID=UPI003F94473B